ncbi:MAG TPA: acyl-CoA dehydrogenase family protein [Vicinamibacterales bacterium]|nr:acyl-CoA dehydrogenase family protein [Vicinamibacterales bacterium]
MILDLTQEQDAFRSTVEQFVRDAVMSQAAAIDESGAFPDAVLKQAAALGLLGLTVPAAGGGAGRDAVDAALAFEAIARASASVAFTLALHNTLVVDVIARFGSEAQRTQWLRRLATGKVLGAFALAEDEAGSDLARLRTTAEPEGTGWRVRGRKVWVANGARAGLAIVVAKAGDGVQAFLIAPDAPGVKRVAHDSVGVRGTGCVDLDLDVTVGADQLLAGGAGLVEWALEGGRIATAAQAIGIGQAGLDEAVAYAKGREAFGKSVASYQSVQWGLADTATELDAARLLTLKAAAARARGAAGPLDTAMAKLYASEAAHRAVDRAAELLAASGYGRGSVIERLCRDVRAAGIHQGTPDVQRMAIAAELLPRG